MGTPGFQKMVSRAKGLALKSVMFPLSPTVLSFPNSSPPPSHLPANSAALPCRPTTPPSPTPAGGCAFRTWLIAWWTPLRMSTSSTSYSMRPCWSGSRPRCKWPARIPAPCSLARALSGWLGAQEVSPL